MDIGEYRRLTRPAADLAVILLGGPKLDDSAADVFAEIEATPPDPLHVSVVTLGEIEQGIARVRGRGDLHQASALERSPARLRCAMLAGMRKARPPRPSAAARTPPPAPRR